MKKNIKKIISVLKNIRIPIRSGLIIKEEINMTEKVSVIVPVFNVEKYLRQCLDSILQQTYQNLEIIIINDGSTDGTMIILDEYKKIKRGRLIGSE